EDRRLSSSSPADRGGRRSARPGEPNGGLPAAPLGDSRATAHVADAFSPTRRPGYVALILLLSSKGAVGVSQNRASVGLSFDGQRGGWWTHAASSDACMQL